MLGEKYGEAFLYTGGVAAFMLPAIFSVLGVYPPYSALFVGIAAAAAFPEYRKMARRGYSHETKGPTMGSILKIFIIWSLGMCAGLGLGIILR